MRGRAAWAMGLLAAALVALRALGRRRVLEAPYEPYEPPVDAPPVAEPPVEASDERADELRRKLAESRELAGERDAFEEGELPVDRVEADDPDARRRAVHDEGRSAVDEMRRGPGSEG